MRVCVKGPGGVVVVVAVRVRFRVGSRVPGAPCFWLSRAAVPAHGSDGAGAARSLTTPSPLRCYAVVNDLTWVGGQAEQRELLWGRVLVVVFRGSEIRKNKKRRISVATWWLPWVLAVKAGKAGRCALRSLGPALTSYMICS
jgi:hypothetical protein